MRYHRVRKDCVVKAELVRIISVLAVAADKKLSPGASEQFVVGLSLGAQDSVFSEPFATYEEALTFFNGLIRGEHSFEVKA